MVFADIEDANDVLVRDLLSEQHFLFESLIITGVAAS
jgi:hypothetical protein